MSGPSSTFELLRRGPFARYIRGESISMLGTWMQQMAQGWVVAGLTTSAFTLGAINFASGVPMLLLTMFGGVLADRHDKRLIVIAALLAQTALALTVGFLVWTNAIAVWHIAAAGVCLGITTAFEVPAVSALVPELVEKEDIGSAIAIDRAVFHATRLAGPALGGWLIGMFGTAAAFFANALSYPALIIALLTIAPRPRGSTANDDEERKTGMREGIVYVRSDPPTIRMIGILALLTICISPFFIILMPLYSRHVLGVGPAQHGILMGASGIGAVIGSVRLLQLAHDRRGIYLRSAAVCICISMGVLAAAHSLVIAVGAMILLTIGTSLLFGLSNTIVQERAPDEVRGRVSAIAGLSFFGVLPFSGLLTSEIADVFGLRAAMLLGALAFAVGAALLLRAKV
jgi:MFS family permease